MKKVLCACLAMLVLLCGAAMAEHFRCELPEGAWLGDTTPLREGGCAAAYGRQGTLPCVAGGRQRGEAGGYAG